MLIGITGYASSGKDTVVNYLKAKGFKHISLSDILRKELTSQKKEITRANLVEIGNRLRQTHGAGVLAQMALLVVNDREDWVISSIGTVGEVELLKKNPAFSLFFVDAPLKSRYTWMKARGREKDPSKTFAEFKKLHELESKGGGQQFRAFDFVKGTADIVIMNDGTIKDLHRKVEGALYHISTRRPTWDDYFLGILDAVRERATCNRGKSGSVIVKDNRILTTGYVGSAIGMAHCDEVGHLMHEVINEDGTRSRHCIRTVHAEQNAICQAARNGIKIEGATLYCSMTPCFTCAKIIINSGIKRVVAAKDYQKSKLSKTFFKTAGVRLDIVKEEVEQYKDAK
jgi:dCMP deaminase